VNRVHIFYAKFYRKERSRSDVVAVLPNVPSFTVTVASLLSIRVVAMLPVDFPYK
jgi:hypothetical protein